MQDDMGREPDVGRAVFIGESITVGFNKPPLLAKKPDCPDHFFWRGNHYQVEEILSEWKDFSRRGRLGRNMRPAHLRRAQVTGSKGSGKFFFRVRTDETRVFDLYYDRAVKNAEEQGGIWVLFREYKQN